MHYVGNLPGWNFHVFHSDQNRARFAGSPTVRRMIAAGRLRMTRIPDDSPLRSHASACRTGAGTGARGWGVGGSRGSNALPVAVALSLTDINVPCRRLPPPHTHTHTHTHARARAHTHTHTQQISSGVSQFLTDPWFWNSIKEEHVMIFQLDAILCSNRDRNVDDYLHYDFIGGPFRHGSVHYNGGLSLRRRSKVLAALAAHDLSTKVWAGDFEDQWFSRTLAGMPGACLPSPRVAGEFSVDLEWYPAPLGGHQVWRWHPPEKLREFEATCPEMRMITNRKHMWR
ncbi:MAG: hypothetical protein BJ554DRAFT_3271, partial [Olpidium bornovanus]